MPSHTLRGVVVALLLLTAGCNGLISHDRQTDTRDQRLRFVVQSEASATQTIHLTFTDQDGQTILNETETLDPNGGWIVTTVNTSTLETPVTVTARLPQQEYANELSPIRETDRGSRLHIITDDGLGHYHCTMNVTCWKQRPPGM